MAVVRTSYTCSKVSEIYRMSNCPWSESSSRQRNLVKEELKGKLDTVQFSQEALDRLELLKQGQVENTLEGTRTVQAEDSKLQESLKKLEMDSDASVDEIRRAYLHAIKHYHPDKHAYLPPEFRHLAEVRSKHINDLYSTLLKRKTGCPRTR